MKLSELSSTFVRAARRRFERRDRLTPSASERTDPRRIRIEASSFCQRRCLSCPTTTGAIHPAIGSGFLRFDDFARLIAWAPRLEHIELCNYGEVFLNPDLPRILQHAHEHRIAVSIWNGANLNNAREEALEALVRYGLREMICSIDGASQETYAKYRVRGNFDAVFGNIEKINHYKKKYRSTLPHLRWQFVVFGHNEHEIPVARSMAEKLGMEFSTKLTWDPDCSPIRDPALVRLHTGSAVASRDEHERPSGESYVKYICHQLWDEPQINFDGKVLGCCRNFWGDFGGNAFTSGIIDGVNHEKMIHARQMLTGRAPLRADIPCSTCDVYIGMQQRDRFLERH